jgi:hypothetical protein
MSKNNLKEEEEDLHVKPAIFKRIRKNNRKAEPKARVKVKREMQVNQIQDEKPLC